MEKNSLIPRPPIVAVMGHIDHGKSTLLDYIRKTNVVEKEAGGITQHISAYEVVHVSKDGKEHKITFLDTPGHEAFTTIRTRGAKVADLAILVVSAEDGVKPQTLEALKVLQKDEIPFIVAINKIDKAGADIDRTKQNLAENEIFLEGYGGHTPWAAISAKTGQGIPDLLDLVILASELEELKANPNIQGRGVIIESNLDTKKGITASAIVLDGTLRRGEFAVSGKSISPLRIIENFAGKPINEATFSSPIKIIGWDSLPKVGEVFATFKEKKDANLVVKNLNDEKIEVTKIAVSADRAIVPIVIKADTTGSLDAALYEISKLSDERIEPKIILSGIGPISENDVRTTNSHESSLLIGFHTKIEPQAESLALRLGIKINSFDIIYKMSEWLSEVIKERTPSVETEELKGRAKILKFFSKTKDKQILGGKVENGNISVNDAVKILRRDAHIGNGRIRELQMQKEKTSTVEEGKEFGAMIDAKIEIAPGDKIESYTVVKK